jgi:hypothetical protein
LGSGCGWKSPCATQTGWLFSIPPLTTDMSMKRKMHCGRYLLVYWLNLELILYVVGVVFSDTGRVWSCLLSTTIMDTNLGHRNNRAAASRQTPNFHLSSRKTSPRHCPRSPKIITESEFASLQYVRAKRTWETCGKEKISKIIRRADRFSLLPSGIVSWLWRLERSSESCSGSQTERKYVRRKKKKSLQSWGRVKGFYGRRGGWHVRGGLCQPWTWRIWGGFDKFASWAFGFYEIRGLIL